MEGKNNHLVWNECGSLYDNAFILAKFNNRFLSLTSYILYFIFYIIYFIFYIAVVAMLFSVNSPFINRAPHPPSRGGVSLTVAALMPVRQGCSPVPFILSFSCCFLF